MSPRIKPRGSPPWPTHHLPLEFEEVPLDEARRMGRGLRMEPMLYDTLRQKIQSLSSEAVRIHLGPEISPVRMKRYIQAIARELNVPLTIRRVPGGVIFWRSSKEDLQQAQGRRCPPPDRPATTEGSPHRAPAEGNPLRAR